MRNELDRLVRFKKFPEDRFHEHCRMTDIGQITSNDIRLY